MSSRPTRETGGGVLSFTFLDVLTCTMGSLVLLVVILGQKAAHTRLEDALRNGPRKAVEPAGVPSAERNSAEVAAKVADLQKQEAKLAELRGKAAQRMSEERSRVSHLEEHERRLEHDLAKLHITLERLADAEKKQSVDQESAERDLKRLKQIVLDTEKQLESIRSEPGGKKSFAIVPYKGANGTFRRPVYIECTKDAVTIQPEGIVLTAIDFDGPIRSGNPLAAAVRAAREELNARAAAAGQTDLPDPYPLIIVRPDGARAYSATLSAISAWDSDYGYEFVDADWKLEYPDPDPLLSQAMVHAVDQARARQAMLAKAAPRRYGGRLTGADRGAGGGGGGSDSESGGGFDTIAQSSGAGDRIGERAGDGLLSTEQRGSSEFSGQPGSAAGNPFADSASGGSAGGRPGGAAGGNFADQFTSSTSGGTAQPPASDSVLGGDATAQMAGGAGGPAMGAVGSTASAIGAEGNGQPGGAAAAGTQGGGPGGPASSGSTSPSSTASAGSAGNAAASAAANAGASNASQEAVAVVPVNPGRDSQNAAAPSAAETRGVNWANEAASRRSAAINRPIQVVVRPDRLDVLPTREYGPTPTANVAVVSFQQPTDKVLDQLAVVVRQQIKDWGLAGQGMYWRPTLVLQVAPGADQHAARLNDLLKDSGVDVRLQQIASRPAEEANDARR